MESTANSFLKNDSEECKIEYDETKISTLNKNSITNTSNQSKLLALKDLEAIDLRVITTIP